MRKTSFLIFTMLFTMLFFLFNATAQRTETIRVKGKDATDFVSKSQYKFPAFTRAKIYLKDGDIASARVNYDYFNQTMKYIGENADTLAIANENDLKYISSDLDTFFYDNKYYEWVASSAKARLAVRRNYKFLNREKTGAYGTSSPAHNVESHDAILGVTHLNLDVNEELTFSKESI
jgi:hypothetical protein